MSSSVGSWVPVSNLETRDCTHPMAVAKALPEGKAAARISRSRAASRARRGFSGATRTPPRSGRALQHVCQLGLSLNVVVPRPTQVEGSVPLPACGADMGGIGIVFDTEPCPVLVVVLQIQLRGVEEPEVLTGEWGRPWLARANRNDSDILASRD